MLAPIYIFLTAQPISLRRLCVFFVLVLTLAAGVLGILRDRAALNDALMIVTALTFLVWSLPLLLTVRDRIRARAISLDVLERVSPVVQWTYGLALAAVPLFVIGAAFSPHHHLVVGTLARTFAIGSAAGLAAPVSWSGFVRRRRHLLGRY